MTAFSTGRPKKASASAFSSVRTIAEISGTEWPLPAMSTRTSLDRKSTRLNSSHSQISYAVFCLKKKNNFINVIRSGRPPASTLPRSQNEAGHLRDLCVVFCSHIFLRLLLDLNALHKSIVSHRV